jgi:cytochrome c553
MKTLLLLALLATAFISTTATADPKKLYKKCISCHGKKGMGKKSQKAPMIAGQYAWYIETQVKAIRDKKRVSKNTKKMYPFVKKLTDDQIKELAGYISKFEVKLNVKK